MCEASGETSQLCTAVSVQRICMSLCLDARICGARLQYQACDRVGL